MLEKLFFINIETASNFKSFEDFQNKDDLGAKLFSKKNKNSNVDELEFIYQNVAPLKSTWGRIINTSFALIDKMGNPLVRTYSDPDESKLLNFINDVLIKAENKNLLICGFNLNKFILPWMFHKLIKYKIKPANSIVTYDKKPWELKNKDIMEDWSGKFNTASSLDEICYELDILEDFNDVKINDLYWNGDLDSIEEISKQKIHKIIKLSSFIYEK